MVWELQPQEQLQEQRAWSWGFWFSVLTATVELLQVPLPLSSGVHGLWDSIPALSCLLSSSWQHSLPLTCFSSVKLPALPPEIADGGFQTDSGQSSLPWGWNSSLSLEWTRAWGWQWQDCSGQEWRRCRRTGKFMWCLGEHLAFISVMPLFISCRVWFDLFLPEVTYFKGFVFEIKF